MSSTVGTSPLFSFLTSCRLPLRVTGSKCATVRAPYDFLVVFDHLGCVSSKPDLRGEALKSIHFEWGFTVVCHSVLMVTVLLKTLLMHTSWMVYENKTICGQKAVCLVKVKFDTLLKMLPLLKHERAPGNSHPFYISWMVSRFLQVGLDDKLDFNFRYNLAWNCFLEFIFTIKL